MSLYSLLIDRTAFTVFGWPVQWYGIILTTGMVTAFVFLILHGKKKNYDTDFLYELFIYTIVFAIIGARLVYVVAHPEYYKVTDFESFKQLFAIWEGGLTIIGGIIFGALGIAICCKINKKSVLKTFDLVVPSLLIGQIIGRWGNFVNQEAYGVAVNNPSLQKFPFAVFIEESGQWHAATFFYEMVLNIIGLIAILVIENKLKPKNGVLTLLYLFWYGVVRAIMEIIRLDAVVAEWGFLGQIKVTQLLCIITSIISLIVVFLIQKGIINTAFKEKSKNAEIKDMNCDNINNEKIDVKAENEKQKDVNVKIDNKDNNIINNDENKSKDNNDK